MTYLCNRCGAIIYEPRTVTSRENLDGENGVEWRTDLYCPECGARLPKGAARQEAAV